MKRTQGIHTTKRERNKRRAAIRTKIELLGLWNINKLALAKEYGVHHSTIDGDIKHILNNMNIIDTQEVKFELNRSYRRIFNKATKALNNPSLNAGEQSRWAAILLETNRQVTSFLEDYGEKEKVADKLETNSTGLDELRSRLEKSKSVVREHESLLAERGVDDGR